ncbi:arrestin domain-containing protein 3-like [Glandiceps talaboti]
MGKLKKFFIVFENNRDVYNAGDVVLGQVKIELEDPLLCRGVRLHFVGKSHVEWDEGVDEDKKYRAESLYFEDKSTLWGKERTNSEGEDPELTAGEHAFPFKVQLPSEGLPCSFEGSPYGYIRYYIKAYIDIPWKFDPATKRAFTVSGIPRDLNDLPDIHNPVHGHDDKTVCCLCCATGPISLDACTDKKGYIPGESIGVTLSIENVTEREIKTKSALMQEVSFTGYTIGEGNAKTMTKLITVTEVRHGCPEAEDATMNWSKQLLLIPPIPATGLEGCPFIDIKYYVEVEAVVVGTVFHLSMKLPIIIGNIPVRSPAPSTEEEPSINMPPPSYEVLFSGKTNIRDKDDDEYTHGQMEFAPRYAYYSVDKRKSRPMSVVSQITYYGSL